MSTQSVTTPVVRIAVSAYAVARLAQALFTWESEKSSFTYHLSLMGQDEVFWDAMEALHAIAHNVDKSYSNWQDLERDFGKDTTNIRAHIELAIGQATVV